LRMSRMNGERWQDYQARRRHAVESVVATRAKETEYELLRRNGIPLASIPVVPACTCSARPYPHHHGESERARFSRRMPPGQEVQQNA